MLDNRKRIYALSGYTVEKRQKNWFLRRTDRDEEPWRGPYSNETSACLTIARLLKSELIRRDDLKLPI